MNAFLGILFCVVVLAIGGWNLHQDHERAKIELVETERSIAQVKTMLSERQAHLETLKRHYELQRRIYDTNQILAEARSIMTELQGSIESQRNIYQSILETRRSSARGTVLGTIELTDGRALRNVKVINFEDTSLTLQTSDGILKIKAQELPSNLQEYFRFDLIEPEIEPMLTAVNPLEGNYSSMSNAANADGGFKYTADALTTSVLASGNPSRMTTVVAELSAVNKRIENLERAKQSPLLGLDARLKPGSASYKFRKKFRDNKLDREIAVLLVRRRSFEAERRDLNKVSLR